MTELQSIHYRYFEAKSASDFANYNMLSLLELSTIPCDKADFFRARKFVEVVEWFWTQV